MMLLLIADVVYHPRQIFGSKTHHSIAALPVQQFTIDQFVVDVVGTRAFEFADPITNRERRRNRYCDVHVCFSAADLVKDQVLSLRE